VKHSFCVPQLWIYLKGFCLWIHPLIPFGTIFFSCWAFRFHWIFKFLKHHWLQIFKGNMFHLCGYAFNYWILHCKILFNVPKHIQYKPNFHLWVLTILNLCHLKYIASKQKQWLVTFEIHLIWHLTSKWMIYLFKEKHNKYISSLYLSFMPFIKAECFSKT